MKGFCGGERREDKMWIRKIGKGKHQTVPFRTSLEGIFLCNQDNIFSRISAGSPFAWLS